MPFAILRKQTGMQHWDHIDGPSLGVRWPGAPCDCSPLLLCLGRFTPRGHASRHPFRRRPPASFTKDATDSVGVVGSFSKPYVGVSRRIISGKF